MLFGLYLKLPTTADEKPFYKSCPFSWPKKDYGRRLSACSWTSPAREAATWAATQGFPDVLWNSKFHSRIYRRPQLASILSHKSIPSHPISLRWITKLNYTPWSESASELYRPSDRRLSAKLVPTFAERGYHVVSVTNSYGRNLGFLDRSRYFFFQVAPHLYSRGWLDPVPVTLLLRKSGSARNRTRASGSVTRNSDH
jgi:hypothetical protein